MNAATLDKSERLQRVHRVLQGGPKTTMEIIKCAGVCAVNSIIAELRANNVQISCTQISKGIYQYRLERLF